MEHEKADSIADDLKEVIGELDVMDGLEEEDGTDAVDGPPEDEGGETEEGGEAKAQEEAQTEVPPQTEATPEEEGKETQRKASKPPVGWAPELKETFSKLPPEVQQAVHNREVEIATILQNTSSERRVANSFMQAVEPFRGLMAAEGVQDPIAAVRGLMTTTAQLAMGTPVQKATKIAELIQHYGVDLDTLDRTLAGQAPSESTADQDRILNLINQRLAPMDSFIQHMQGQQQQSFAKAQQDAVQSIQEFGQDAKNEFFDEVRADMADLLEIAAHRGQTMSLKQAYDRACMANDRIAAIIADRRAKGYAEDRNTVMQRKRDAASSVTTTSAAGDPPAVDEDDSIRGILEQQLSSASGRI